MKDKLNKQNAPFKIQRIAGSKLDTLILCDFRKIVFESENLYPGIDLWFKRQVEPGLGDGSRIGYVAYEKETPVAGVVIRLSNRAKICNLRVLPEARGKRLGCALFNLAAQEVSKYYNNFHFTAPESLKDEMNSYFCKIGFNYAGKVDRTYRPGEGEFAFEGKVAQVLKNTEGLIEHTLFGTTLRQQESFLNQLVMSIKPRFAQMIMAGNKRIELRRIFSKQHTGAQVLIYSSSPQKALLGFARIAEVSEVPVTSVINNLRDEAQCGIDEIKNYAEGIDSLWAITLSEVNPFLKPIYLKELESIINTTPKPPQSYFCIKQGSAWEEISKMMSDMCKRDNDYGIDDKPAKDAKDKHQEKIWV